MNKKILAAVVATGAFIGGVGSAAPANASLTLPHFASHTIMVEDHTGSRWPVRASVLQWDQGTDASIRYGKCIPTAGCVRIYEANLGRNQTAGHTLMSWYQNTRVLNPVKITMNDSYYLSAHQRRQAVEHELGHSFGLTYHSRSRGSAMYYLISNNVSMYPSAYDKSILNALY